MDQYVGWRPRRKPIRRGSCKRILSIGIGFWLWEELEGHSREFLLIHLFIFFFSILTFFVIDFRLVRSTFHRAVISSSTKIASHDQFSLPRIPDLCEEMDCGSAMEHGKNTCTEEKDCNDDDNDYEIILKQSHHNLLRASPLHHCINRHDSLSVDPVLNLHNLRRHRSKLVKSWSDGLLANYWCLCRNGGGAYEKRSSLYRVVSNGLIQPPYYKISVPLTISIAVDSVPNGVASASSSSFLLFLLLIIIIPSSDRRMMVMMR